MSRLENWFFAADDADPLKDIHSKNIRICGELYEDERFPEGYEVITSPVRKVDSGCLVTKNTPYRLGKVSEAYREKYPDCVDKMEKHGIVFHEGDEV